MKIKRLIEFKSNSKFIRINDSSWIETDAWKPDEVARMQFLQKLEMTKPAKNLGQLKNGVSVLNN